MQRTSDGHKAYPEAVEAAFNADMDHAQLIKIFGWSWTKGHEAKYRPGVCTGILKKPIEGALDLIHISTSFAERRKLTLRMRNWRFMRLTNGFSKMLENHAYSLALFLKY